MQGSPLELRILGTTELAGSNTADAGANVLAPKRLALLAYLALDTAEGFRRRDQILGLLWPDLTQDAARTQLRKTLSTLRELLGPDSVVSRGDSEVRLDPARIWCDAVALIQHTRSGDWKEALALYRGELLEGFFVEGVDQEWDEWLAEKRKALRSHAARAAWECSRSEEAAGDWKAAAVMARRAHELAPDDEDGVRRLMSLLDRAGDRGSALRVYSEWRLRLQSEYGVEPAPETRKLARQVQAARKGESHETPPLEASVVTERTTPAPAANASGRRPHARPDRIRTYMLGGAVLLAAAAGAVVLRSALIDRHPAQPGSLAVTPVRVIGAGLVAEARGVAEELTTALIQSPGLIVHPLSGKGGESVCEGDAVCIGRRLKVAFVLDGAVQGDAEAWRITLRLVRTSDGAARWAGRYDMKAADGASALQRVASELVATLSPLLLEPESGKPRSITGWRRD
jgi:DNA-binding SARP family transcriptional activator/TolB-like protein